MRQRMLVAVLVTVVLLLTGLTAATAQDGTSRGARRHTEPTALRATQTRRHTEATAFRTTRTFSMGAGHGTRTFTLRERSGVILINRTTVLKGVRAYVVARIPHLAGARVNSWGGHSGSSLSCRQRGTHQICTQGEEWCPMPQAAWHFKLVKLSGPGGPIRFQYVVAPPPAKSDGSA